MKASHSPSYHVAYQYIPVTFDDFVPVGIFTNKADADVFNETLTGSHAVVERTHEQLSIAFARYYLGELLAPLEKLCTQYVDPDLAAAGGYGI